MTFKIWKTVYVFFIDIRKKREFHLKKKIIKKREENPRKDKILVFALILR